MRVAYFVQTHRLPAQIYRLLSTLRRGSPEAILVVGHDPAAEPLDRQRLAALAVHELRPARRPQRGYWSMFEPFPVAVELLDKIGAAYDWLVYLSGQDYPARPLEQSEAALAASPYDGYLTWIDAAGESPEGRHRQGMLRYHYQYTDVPRAAVALRFLRRLNGLQPWWHVHRTYGPRLGRRAAWTPFRPDFLPYWGSQWTTLRRECAESVAEASRGAKALVEYFARTVCPDESFAQTVLVNDSRFRLCNDNLRFVDVRGSRDGHPRILRLADGPALLGGGYSFARKFDIAVDETILDWLDARLTFPVSPSSAPRTAAPATRRPH